MGPTDGNRYTPVTHPLHSRWVTITAPRRPTLGRGGGVQKSGAAGSPNDGGNHFCASTKFAVRARDDRTHKRPDTAHTGSARAAAPALCYQLLLLPIRPNSFRTLYRGRMGTVSKNRGNFQKVSRNVSRLKTEQHITLTAPSTQRIVRFRPWHQNTETPDSARFQGFFVSRPLSCAPVFVQRRRTKWLPCLR